MGGYISIHAPREGSDGPLLALLVKAGEDFYPRSPRGERPRCTTIRRLCPADFYPRSPRGERPHPIRSCLCLPSISIHAPREGSDGDFCRPLRHQVNFYPRSPRGERHEYRRCCRQRYNFYPRSPRGERHLAPIVHHLSCYFYPRSPRGERPGPQDGAVFDAVISIHAPREGSDAYLSAPMPESGTFLSTLPARGATAADGHGPQPVQQISIHAPREGSDSKCAEK